MLLRNTCLATIGTLAALASGMASPATAQPAMAQQPPSDGVCPAQEANSADNVALLNQLMVEPRKIASFADLLKALPPEAMAKLATMQKTAFDRQAKDWAYLCRYAAENAQVLASRVRTRVVFIGDSITENWKVGDPSLFSATMLDRGIGGQTSPQILLRFYQDVVALHPRVVHIMAGVNDIMGNTGPTSDDAIVNNIRAMIDMAKANGISVVLAGITPCKQFIARPGHDLSPRIAAVNRKLVLLAAQRHVTFVDYSAPLAAGDGSLKSALANDGLHPNRDGYALMRPLTERAIARATR